MAGRLFSALTVTPEQWRFAWRDAWSELRNRLLASARFQHWASRFPLTRPIARQRAQAAFDLCAGFVYSQVLFTCVQLRVFEILMDEPQELDALAQQIGLSRDRAARLFDAAVALDLLEVRGRQRYGLGPQGAVVVGNEGIAAMIRHHAMLYEDLRDPIALLRDEAQPTQLGQYWPYAETTQAAALAADQVSAYSDLMAASQTLIAQEVLSAYSLRRHRRLLDVGGGSGAFLSAVAARWPHLDLMLFDLPGVVEKARTRLAEHNLAGRVQTFGGDFFANALPDGADLISLVRVIHDHNDPDVLHLLRSIHARLPANGRLLLAEPMAGHRDSDRVAKTYFGFYLMAMGKGRPRTPTEISAMLREAGFSRSRLLSNQMPLQTRVMVAEK